MAKASPEVLYRARFPLLLVDAFQITHEARADNRTWPHWLHRAWNKDKDKLGAVWPSRGGLRDFLFVRTYQGPQRIAWGDYLLRNRVDEALYIADKKTFKALFEKVS
jgi:hypothetical protein